MRWSGKSTGKLQVKFSISPPDHWHLTKRIVASTTSLARPYCVHLSSTVVLYRAGAELYRVLCRACTELFRALHCAVQSSVVVCPVHRCADQCTATAHSSLLAMVA